MPEDAIDLVDKLLQLNPLERLGGGPPDSNLSYDALKAHPFFKGINFTRIANKSMAPPIPVDLFKQAMLPKIEISAKDFGYGDEPSTAREKQ